MEANSLVSSRLSDVGSSHDYVKDGGGLREISRLLRADQIHDEGGEAQGSAQIHSPTTTSIPDWEWAAVEHAFMPSGFSCSLRVPGGAQ